MKAVLNTMEIIETIAKACGNTAVLEDALLLKELKIMILREVLNYVTRGD